MRTKAILPILVLLTGSAALPLESSAFADSQTNNSSTTTDPISQLFALIQNLLSRITGLEKEVSALQQKTNTLESHISQLENSNQNTTSDDREEQHVTILSNSTHNDGHDNEHDHENDANKGNHFGQDKQHGNKHGQNKQDSD